jgi:uncharacterized protein YkwD
MAQKTHRIRPTRAFRPEPTDLEPRRLMSASPAPVPAVEPTAEEQYMLQLVNRARANPAAEGRRLMAEVQADPVLKSMARSADLAMFSRILSRTPPRPPLALGPRLTEAARDVTVNLVAENAQRHSPPGFLTDPAVALADDGQAYFPVTGASSWATGENLFAFSRNVQDRGLTDTVNYFHAGLMLDWGNPDFGHLRNLLAPGVAQARPDSAPPFREIGIGLLSQAEPTAPATAEPDHPWNAGLSVGPVIVAQEFGYRADQPGAVVGAVYRDADADRFYTPGEGVGSAVIVATSPRGGTFQTTTRQAGGFTLPLPAGIYRVSVSVAGVEAAPARLVRVAHDNVNMDVRIPAQAGRG